MQAAHHVLTWFCAHQQQLLGGPSAPALPVSKHRPPVCPLAVATCLGQLSERMGRNGVRQLAKQVDEGARMGEGVAHARPLVRTMLQQLLG